MEDARDGSLERKYGHSPYSNAKTHVMKKTTSNNVLGLSRTRSTHAPSRKMDLEGQNSGSNPLIQFMGKRNIGKSKNLRIKNSGSQMMLTMQDFHS